MNGRTNNSHSAFNGHRTAKPIAQSCVRRFEFTSFLPDCTVSRKHVSCTLSKETAIGSTYDDIIALHCHSTAEAVALPAIA